MDESNIRNRVRLFSWAVVLFLFVAAPAIILAASLLAKGVYFFLLTGAAAIVVVPIFDTLLMAGIRRFVRQVRQYQWFYLDDSQLEIGDIIASRNAGKGSRLIQQVTGGDYSHVALYLGGGQIIEAVPPRVHVIHIPFHMMADKNDVKVFRGVQPIPKVKAMCGEAYRYSFNLYSFAKAASFAFPAANILVAPDANICSELIVLLYRAGGLDIFRNLQRPSPSDICRCKKLRDVSRTAVLPVPDSEITNALWEVSYSTLSLVQFIKRIGAWLFAAVYRISPLRLALNTSPESWTFAEKGAFYGIAIGFLIKQVSKIVKSCVFFTVLWFRRHSFSRDEVERARRKISRARRVALELLALDNRGIRSFEKYPMPWPYVFALLMRAGKRLRLAELGILARTANLVDVDTIGVVDDG